MPFTTQMKLLYAMRQMVLGDGRTAFPKVSPPKPDFASNFVPDYLPTTLPRCTPEQQGLCSDNLADFYTKLTLIPSAHLHSALVLRGGNVVSEGYFAPFRKDMWHISHSLCKTIVGLAVGIAVSEGLFSLNDPIIKYFPKEVGVLASKQVASITVKHLLTMSSGLSFNELAQAVETNWIKCVLSSPIVFEPGTKFVYNSMNTYLLSALICRTSGQTLTNYLTPRLFAPLGFGAHSWEVSPEGIEKGGWGLYLMVEDIAKLGQLFLQKGKWYADGKPQEIVSEDWIVQSTRAHNLFDDTLGYGYQCWVDTANESYTMNGIFGQYVTVFPKKDIVVVTTAGSSQLFLDSPLYFAIASHFSNVDDKPSVFSPSPAASARLERVLGSLQFRKKAIAPPVSLIPLRRKDRQKRTSLWQTPPSSQLNLHELKKLFCDVKWEFQPNYHGLLPMIIQTMNNEFSSGLKSIHLSIKKDQLILRWRENDVEFLIPVGFPSSPECIIQTQNESFYVASRATIHTEYDESTAILIELCFLEHSSFRTIKLTREADNLILKLNEHPHLQVAIDGSMYQMESTGFSAHGATLESIFKNIDYFDYRINSMCAPTLLGKPAKLP